MFERGGGGGCIQIFGFNAEDLFEEFKPFGKLSSRGEQDGGAGGQALEELTVRLRIQRNVEQNQRQPEPEMIVLGGGLRCELQNAGQIGKRSLFELCFVTRK